MEGTTPIQLDDGSTLDHGMPNVGHSNVEYEGEEETQSREDREFQTDEAAIEAESVEDSGTAEEPKSWRDLQWDQYDWSDFEWNAEKENLPPALHQTYKNMERGMQRAFQDARTAEKEANAARDSYLAKLEAATTQPTNPEPPLPQDNDPDWLNKLDRRVEWKARQIAEQALKSTPDYQTAIKAQEQQLWQMRVKGIMDNLSHRDGYSKEVQTRMDAIAESNPALWQAAINADPEGAVDHIFKLATSSLQSTRAVKEKAKKQATAPLRKTERPQSAASGASPAREKHPDLKGYILDAMKQEEQEP
jgi:hypothetical protein